LIRQKKFSSQGAEVTLDDLNKACQLSLGPDLMKIGIPEDKLGIVFPHRVSHALGIDVHDCSKIRNPIIKEGFTFTIEPGVYLPNEQWVPEEYRLISVRVEDDCVALLGDIFCPTAEHVRSIKDIEKECGIATR